MSAPQGVQAAADPQAAANLRATGDRIEHLLDELAATADPRSRDRVEEVLRLVADLYGAGLTRVVELVGASAPALMDDFVGDELIASLLLVHDLHPESLVQRVQAALAKVRPFLATHDGDVELLDIDPAVGAVLLRLLGTCDGCPSSAVTLQTAVERAVYEAAPEIVRIDVDQPSQAVPDIAVSLIAKPAYQECPVDMVGA